MKKEELLSFNLGPVYLDYLQSFKRELTSVLTSDGRISAEDLIIQETFQNIDSASSALVLNMKDAYDEFQVYMNNRMSRVLFTIDELDVRNVSIALKRSKSDGGRAWSQRTLSEIITQGDIVETIILWIQDAKLTPWAEEHFTLRENQFVADEC